MTVDREEHRVLLLQMLDGMQFGGALRDVVYELGIAVKTATVSRSAPLDQSNNQEPGKT